MILRDKHHGKKNEETKYLRQIGPQTDWGESVASPLWDFAPQPRHQQCAHAWSPQMGFFSLLFVLTFLSQLPSNPRLWSFLLLFPHYHFKTTWFPQVHMHIYVVVLLTGGGGEGSLTPPSFSRMGLKRGNQQLSLICQKPETPLPLQFASAVL